MQLTPMSLTASLSLAGPACNAFGADIHDLILSANYETSSRLHVHIYDKAKTQFQIPESILRSPGGAADATRSDFEVDSNSSHSSTMVVDTLDFSLNTI